MKLQSINEGGDSMLTNFIGMLGTYTFLFGSVYLILRYSIFKTLWSSKIVCHKFLLNEIVCIVLSIIIVTVCFSVTIN